MDDNAEVERARFEWRAFGRTLAVWGVDFCCAAAVVAAVWCFVRYCVFCGERISASAHEVSEIVSAMAWPSAFVLVLLLFRNPLLRVLNELPTFIKKSYYRCGEKPGPLEPDDASEELSEGGKNSDASDEKSSAANRFPKDAAEIIGKALARKYGGQYYIGKCIGNRRYIFDVVIDTPYRLFGVELKETKKTTVWSDLFHRVSHIYEDCSDAVKRRFVFVPVVMNTDTKGDVERMAVNFEFKTVVEMFGSQDNAQGKE